MHHRHTILCNPSARNVHSPSQPVHRCLSLLYPRTGRSEWSPSACTSSSARLRQLLQVEIKIMRRLTELLPVEVAAGIRNFIQIVFVLMLQNVIAVITGASVYQHAAKRFADTNQIRAIAADRTIGSVKLSL